MKLHAYCVYDRKAMLYNSPFFAVSDGAAARSFSDLANDLQTTVGRHPMDYVLFRVGQFDDQTAIMETYAAVHIADANAMVAPKAELPFTRSRANGEA